MEISSVLAISGFLNAISAFLFGIVVFSKNPQRITNKIFLLMSLSITTWGIGYGFWLLSNGEKNALFWSRFLSLGSTFIPVTFLHWILTVLDLHKEKNKKRILILCYILTFIFALFSFSPLYVKKVQSELFFNFWPKPGILYNFYLLFGYIGMVSYATFLLIKKFKTSQGYLREQIKYILLAIALGFGGGATNFPLWYGIPLLPLGNFLVFLYPLIIGYAMTRYRLMDIQLAIGRTVVYIFSFLVIILIAFFLNYLNSLLPSPVSPQVAQIIIIIISISIFPPIFRLFEKLASRYFYYTFYSYQTVLTELGKKLTQILDIKKLSSLIVNTLVETMKLDRVVILWRKETGEYEILKNIGFREENGISLVRDNFLTQYLEKTKKPLVYEELTLAIRDATDEKEKEKLTKLKRNMEKIEANLCLPLFQKEKLVGIIVLGKKISQNPYSKEDINLLTALSSQASIALSNAFLYSKIEDLSQNLQEKVKEQVKQIEELSQMKSEFLKVVNHQLRTPVTIVKGLVSMFYKGEIPEERKKEFLEKLYFSSERLSTILDDILVAQRFVGKEESVSMNPARIEEIIKRVIAKLSPQAEAKGLKINLNYEKNLPQILCDEEGIERAFLRIIDNAILYTEKGEINISISLQKDKEKEKRDYIVVEVKDEGIGLDEEEKKKLFSLFFRGKRATSIHPNGTGLGLFIANEFIKAHHGKIEVFSEGKDKGTTFKVYLPVIQEL